MSSYVIYSKENEEIKGVFNTYKKAGDFLGLSPDAIQKGIKRKSIIKRKYIIRKIEVKK
jgi:hypothetical protein